MMTHLSSNSAVHAVKPDEGGSSGLGGGGGAWGEKASPGCWYLSLKLGWDQGKCLLEVGMLSCSRNRAGQRVLKSPTAGVDLWVFSCKGVVLRCILGTMKVVVLLNKLHRMLTCCLILSQFMT